MAAIYFISDVHLGLESAEEEAAKEVRLLRLLDRVSADGVRLYILGDLFDFWFEYRDAIPGCGTQTLAALKGLTGAGVEVHYLAGNHDFALGPYLSDTIGCILHYDPFDAEYGGNRFYLHHGDGLAGRDLGYRILKKVIRNRLSKWMWRLVHPDIGFALARRFSGASRSYTDEKDYGRGEILDSFLLERAGEGYGYIVMGHAHVAEDRKLEGGCRYINLGSWLGGGAPFARFEDGVMTVIRPDGSGTEN
jgi:UDP-2,3-diacylglucosamine hydrolase